MWVTLDQACQPRSNIAPLILHPFSRAHIIHRILNRISHCPQFFQPKWTETGLAEKTKTSTQVGFWAPPKLFNGLDPMNQMGALM
jgi:hypothetical protein